MINVAVCDDNEDFLDFMCITVREMLKKSGISAMVTDYLSGAVFLEHHRLKPFDVVFLDILMPNKDGFEIAKEIRKFSENTYIIFITIEENLVYDSFDFRPFHFVPKSALLSSGLFEYRLYHVINKLAVHISEKRSVYLEMAFGEKRYVDPSEIISVTSKANYIDYCLSTGEVLHIRGKIEDAEEILSPKLFVRIHNRCIINLSRLIMIDNPNNRVLMSGGHKLGVSRRYKKDLSDAYTQYLKNFK